MKDFKVNGNTQEVLADYLTRSELARELNRSERTLDRWHQLRIGPPRSRIGSMVIYRRAALGEWLRAQEKRG